MPSVKYNYYLETNPAFESVVDIDADQRNANLWREYIVGEDMEKLVEYLCESLGNEAPDLRRSFWVHGSYGTGKSYAAIFVKHLMEEKPKVVDDFLAASGRLSQYRNRFAKCRKNGDYLVVWKTGCTGIRSGDMLLLEAERAIHDALIAKFGEDAHLGSSSLIDAVKEKLRDPSINWEYILETTTLGDDNDSVEILRKKVEQGDMTALKNTATVIRQKGYGLVNNLETFKAWLGDVIDENHLSQSGIFFIWDEFTEYVTNSDDHTVMQQLSEFSKVKPFFMLYVVHKSQEMVDSMGKDKYQLITNRFHEVEFHVSPDAAFDLIAGSINIKSNMAEHWKEAQKTPVDRIKPFLPDIAGLDDKISEQIHILCPMHPMTIRLLSRVAESFAAAQRTMFRFMKDRSNSDLGFTGYINKYGPDDQACWLTPDWLWDYFFTRESDFNDKDTKAAAFIHHYEESRHLVENDENAHRVFKIAMLLLAVMSSTKRLHSGARAHGGIAATAECLELCLSGVMDKRQVKDLLQTLEDCKVLLRDEAANGVVRLEMPFRGDNGDEFDLRFEANDKKYTRYQMFSHDGELAKELEKKAWDENDASLKRMKICACCAETNSINTRLAEIKKELDKFPYKLGLLLVTVRDDAQYVAIQSDLAKRVAEEAEPRLTIALAKAPFTDEARKKWLTSLTKQEMATGRGQIASASQYRLEANTVIASWVGSVTSGSKILAWNEDQMFTNLYGMAHLRKTIQTNVLQRLFPYGPESIVVTNTAYKPCNEAAPLAGITREAKNAQLGNVLNSLKVAGLIDLLTIDSMVAASGSKAATAISELAKAIQTEMLSGQRVILGDLWAKLQRPPFGYYNTIACGVLLGYVFSCYKDSAFCWTDNAQSTHVLGETTLNTMVVQMCKGTMTTDYLSAGTVTFQNFRRYAQKILHLTDAQIANETECCHNMREAITKAGTPLWALKYLPEATYGSKASKNAAMQIVDNMQQFISQDGDRESFMSNVLQQFTGRGKLREALGKAFQDKNTMNTAFRAFLFAASPALQKVTEGLAVPPEELSDKLHTVMQGAIYTWTEDQVREKLPDVVSDYNYLHVLNEIMQKVSHSPEEAKKDLAALFQLMRISLTAIEKSGAPWYPALAILRKVSKNGTSQMSAEERSEDIHVLTQYGQHAMDCLRDARPVLADMLEAQGIACTQAELDAVYAGLKDMSCDASLTQFEKELQNQIRHISYARNRILLTERWQIRTGEDSIKSWCKTHGVPLLWIVKGEQRKALATVNDVFNGISTLDQNVQRAMEVLDTMDPSIFTDDDKIQEAFLATVGEEYRPIVGRERNLVMSQAKMKLGNDMSAWDMGDLSTLQKMLKGFLQEKAKKEKLEKAQKHTDSMDAEKLRQRVREFMANHPEFCDDFLD